MGTAEQGWEPNQKWGNPHTQRALGLEGPCLLSSPKTILPLDAESTKVLPNSLVRIHTEG